jgi:hypothetical protein
MICASFGNSQMFCRRLSSGFPIIFLGFMALLLNGCTRSNSQAAAPQVPSFEFVGEWGTRGDDPGQLNDPVGPAVDNTGRVYFASRGRESVDKFTAIGTPLLSFQDPAVRNASAIALDSGGGIYVADLHVGMVRLFFPEGDFLRSFHVPPQRNYQGPFAFSVDSEGNIFVPDPEGGRIQRINSHGTVGKEWKIQPSASGQPGRPAIAVAGQDGFVYVGDVANGRIMKYADGALLAVWGATSGSPGALLSIAASAKYLYVLRNADPCLEVWTFDGQRKFIDNLGGRLDVTSPSKASLAITSQNELVVLDPTVPRILHFRIHLDSP